MLRSLAVALFVLLLLGLLAAAELQQRWQRPLNLPGDDYILVVEPGDSLRSVAGRLEQEGVYPDPLLLRIYGRITGLDQQIRHGEYRVERGATARDLLYLLHEGRVISYQVTLPEGITLAEAVRRLAAAESLQSVLDGAGDQRLLALVAPYENPEGWFFPDSYHYQRGTTDLEILQRAHTAMREVLAQAWEERAEGLPYANAYEALIMASIVERETGVPEEREQIAGVFVRRLQRGMRLQTDPTVIYGLGEDFDGNLRRAHLRDPANAYNTYSHAGLPPSPIALPGRAAIVAALHPDQGDTLYFVARGDGGHYFSRTLAEHEKAVREYQLRRRQDYRSSPQAGGGQ
ncbi:endolytic transglycosylase MltG [Haliea sp. E17]|uniref:endolytic transglycosylase MltG n=1 Tax=Haliea sp. E17 TaxID=3401576 RepID=UPI003AAEAE63